MPSRSWVPRIGFQKLDIRKCIQNIPGNRDVALWIPQSFLQERIMSLDGIGEASTIQKSFLPLVSLHALAEMVQAIHPGLVHVLVTFGDSGGNDMH